MVMYQMTIGVMLENLEAYLKAHYDILNGKIKISIPGKNRGDNIWIDSDTQMNPHQK